MKIIDFYRKGNMVRFFLAKDDSVNYGGDDWNDSPYEHNAGEVYGQYVDATVDFVFPFDALVLEPCSGISNSGYSKDDMKARMVPCIIVVPERLVGQYFRSDFAAWVGSDKVVKFYFGDEIKDDKIPKNGNFVAINIE